MNPQCFKVQGLGWYQTISQNQLSKGILTEGGRLSTVDLLLKVTGFVTKVNKFSI